ncbi:MAG: hypothetical protein NTZ83_03510 [Candidatus Pacearchaeota archaeon]|nr:hypothetical protein [Candidatus Pacearchaeota archaeon]
MKPTKEQIKIIKSLLTKIYSDYKNKGLISVYLWGSVLTNDFNPKSSDIDSIAIVSNNAKEEDCKLINQYIKKRSAEFRDFKLNYLYLDELNGEKIKSKLASVIHPSLLLLDFKNWKYIAGKRYSRRDFKLKEIDFDEAVRLNLIAIKKNHLPLFKKWDFKVTQYFIKNLIKVCYYLNQKDFGKHKFKYNELLEKSPKKREKIVRVLLKIRKSNWDERSIKNNLPLLIDFINNLS